MTAYDVLLDSVSGDLPDHCYLSTGPDIVRQRLQIRLRTMLGEWFLDQNVGIPLQQWLSTKGTSRETMSARIQAEVAGCPGVTKVTAWAYTWTPATSTLTMTGEATIEGEAAATPVTVTMTPNQIGNYLPMVAFARMMGM